MPNENKCEILCFISRDKNNCTLSPKTRKKIGNPLLQALASKCTIWVA
jgi:hypothetical protein